MTFYDKKYDFKNKVSYFRTVFKKACVCIDMYVNTQIGTLVSIQFKPQKLRGLFVFRIVLKVNFSSFFYFLNCMLDTFL